MSRLPHEQSILLYVVSLPPTYHRCALIVSEFFQLDLEKDDVCKFLKETVLPVAEGIL